jgi:hypothetical protein
VASGEDEGPPQQSASHEQKKPRAPPVSTPERGKRLRWSDRAAGLRLMPPAAVKIARRTAFLDERNSIWLEMLYQTPLVQNASIGGRGITRWLLRAPNPHRIVHHQARRCGVQLCPRHDPSLRRPAPQRENIGGAAPPRQIMHDRHRRVRHAATHRGRARAEQAPTCTSEPITPRVEQAR